MKKEKMCSRDLPIEPRERALRRQKQLIGKLMRNVDAEPIRAALASVQARGAADKRLFAAAEQWRDRVVDEGDSAVTALREQTGCGCEELDTLVAELRRAMGDKARKTIKRRIFRVISAALVATTRDDRISQ